SPSPTRRKSALVRFPVSEARRASSQSSSSSKNSRLRSLAKAVKLFTAFSDKPVHSTFLQNSSAPRERLVRFRILPSVELASARKYAMGSNAIVVCELVKKNGLTSAYRPRVRRTLPYRLKMLSTDSGSKVRLIS